MSTKKSPPPKRRPVKAKLQRIKKDSVNPARPAAESAHPGRGTARAPKITQIRPIGRPPLGDRSPEIDVRAASERRGKKKPVLPKRRPKTRLDIIKPIRPVPRRPGSIRSLFSRATSGSITVVRPDDLLALRIEFEKLRKVPATAKQREQEGINHVLKTIAGSNTGFIILHFQPQAITEETFYETPQADPDNQGIKEFDTLTPQYDDLVDGAVANTPPGYQPKPTPEETEELEPPPIRARIANESRLVFKVPTTEAIPYTLQGILEACRRLEPAVAPNARASSLWQPAWTLNPKLIKAIVNQTSLKGATRFNQSLLKNLILAKGLPDTSTLRRRQLDTSKAVSDAISVAERPQFQLEKVAPKPRHPSRLQTAIEIPWRLILSPNKSQRWQHALAPLRNPATGISELWHSRLTVPDDVGNFIEPGKEDPNRNIRAIWARNSEEKDHDKAMTSEWPDSSELPSPSLVPFRMPLDDFDRYQISHLSSNFSVSGYAPQPVNADLMMLSSMGGWLDSRGAWDGPGMSVEEWSHRASMARDHYVRVVYRGFLYPLGHRVSLIKVSERKFHNGVATDSAVNGNPAYLRQRMFIVVRERERHYDLPAYAQLKNSSGQYCLRQFPFAKVRILTQVTPTLDPPGNSDINDEQQRFFWPQVAGQYFRFQCAGTDLDGQRLNFELPMIFMDNTLACPRRKQANKPGELVPDYDFAWDNAKKASNAFAESSKKTCQFKFQKLALAVSQKSGDTSVEISQLDFGGEPDKNAGNANIKAAFRTASDDLTRPMFFPVLSNIRARIGAMAYLGGNKQATNLLEWNDYYLKHGFDATGEGN